MSTESHMAKVKRQHLSDMSNIERENAKKYRKEQQRKRRKLAEASTPPAFILLKRNIYRTEMLLRAAKMATKKPGSLRRTFEKIAAPIVMIDSDQTGVEYWLQPPAKFFYQSPFHSFFGFVGVPAECKDGQGLTGDLFDDETPHDPASLRAYIETWLDELNRQVMVLRNSHTQIEEFGNGVTQTFTPNW